MKLCVVLINTLHVVALLQSLNATVRFYVQFVGGAGCFAALLAAGALCVVLVTDRQGQASQEGAAGDWACTHAHILFLISTAACQ